MAGKKYGVIHLSMRAGELDTDHCSEEQREILTFGCVIYIYYGRRSFYVGQTDRFLTRHDEHMAEVETDYRQFEKAAILFGQYVDGNSQNDLEALLITYLTADQENLPRKEKRVCRNRTQGNRFVDYPYREDVLTQVLTPFWEQELYKAGLVHQKSLDVLRNSILFKYSPFTELSEEQSALIHEIEEGPRSVLIEGTAGTGKTVVLTNLAARLCEHHKWNVGVVVKANWVKTARSIFRAYGLGKNIEVGTAYQLIRQKKRFHILLVDEAHRLRWNSPKQNHLTTGIFDSNDPRKNELFLLGEMAERLVLFYDSIQAIRRRIFRTGISRIIFRKRVWNGACSPGSSVCGFRTRMRPTRRMITSMGSVPSCRSNRMHLIPVYFRIHPRTPISASWIPFMNCLTM